ncbi:MAG: helix-turn-helix transcriptional regulator [Lachnospiraceae bacterium]|nr:helix-turn-helix transcriptional regulator [Lachnospiraceae bacterium]MBR3262181.1 helix-turn-helix transcriptional regulator [Lachnospiraceae bacterium]
MTRTWLPSDTRQRIQDLIKDSSITQAELAGIIGLSESALSRYLKGQTEMLGDGYIIKIAKYFNVSTDFILGETNIPDRKNYDIEELGLSAESAKLLYTGKIDARILNLLLENPRFPQLAALLARYQNEIVKSGIAAMNQQLSFLSSLLLDQADNNPDSAESARQAAQDISAIRTPIINADTTAIQNVFMLIVRDIKEQGETIVTDSKAASAEVMQKLRKELSKGQDSPDLRNLTAEDLTAAVMKTIAATGISEDTLQSLGSAYTKVLEEMKDLTHDE